MFNKTHLDVQLQDICIGSHEVTEVGFSAAEVSVHKLFNVTAVLYVKGNQNQWQNVFNVCSFLTLTLVCTVIQKFQIMRMF